MKQQDEELESEYVHAPLEFCTDHDMPKTVSFGRAHLIQKRISKALNTMVLHSIDTFPVLKKVPVFKRLHAQLLSENAKLEQVLQVPDQPCERMKSCGHACQLWSVSRCCACSDTRAMITGSYRRYVDGQKYDSNNNAANKVSRETFYCFSCRDDAFSIYSSPDYKPYQPRSFILSTNSDSNSLASRKKKKNKGRRSRGWMKKILPCFDAAHRVTLKKKRVR
jgi:hypothetical protein